MSETSEKIARLLEDPESIKMITEIAESFMSEGTSEKSDETEKISETALTAEEVSVIPDHFSSDLSAILGKIEKSVSTKDIDKTVTLIQALRPYLSSRRSHNADTVVKYLSVLKNVSGVNLSKLTSILGLFNNKQGD